MTESLGNSICTARMEFVDAENQIARFVPLFPYREIELWFGHTLESITKLGQFQFISDRCFALNILGAPQQWRYIIVFTSPMLKGLVEKEYSRAFLGMPISEVASKIATEVLAKTLQVEEATPVGNWIQANWTNRVMLEYLVEKAKSVQSGRGGFVWAVDKRGKFIFNSIETLLKQEPVKKLKYDQTEEVMDEREGFMDFAWGSEGLNRLYSGGELLIGSYWDWQTGEVVKVNSSSDEVKVIGTLAKTEKVKTSEKKCWLGSGSEVFDYERHLNRVQAKVVSKVSGLNFIQIIVPGSNDIDIGTVILALVTGDDGKPVEVASGKWLVWKVTNFFVGRSYITKCLLCRPSTTFEG